MKIKLDIVLQCATMGIRTAVKLCEDCKAKNEDTVSNSRLIDGLCADDIKEITEKVAEKEQRISSERGTYWHIAELTKVAIAETLNKLRST